MLWRKQKRDSNNDDESVPADHVKDLNLNLPKTSYRMRGFLVADIDLIGARPATDIHPYFALNELANFDGF